MRIYFAAAALVTVACAHVRVKQADGCWVQEVENRWGDTHDTVAVCEPKAPSWSPDPIARSVEACLYQAQMAWYNEAIANFRAGKSTAALPDWTAASQNCLGEAQRTIQSQADKAQAALEAAQRHEKELADENQQLRDTIVSCVEKQPNAIATANATTTSDSNAGSGSDTHTSPPEKKVEKEEKVATDPPRRRDDVVPAADLTPAPAPASQPVKVLDTAAKPGPACPPIR